VKLDEIVPWGRTYEEYTRMFDLGVQELSQSILGCGDGPAAFNADATSHGSRVVSVDPLYAFSAESIRARIEDVCPRIVEGLQGSAEKYVWDQFDCVDALVDARLTAMNRFLEDYENGLSSGRYIAAGLPALPFEDNQFDLTLVSHLLFSYSTQIDRQMHQQSVRELMRVSREIRIFPLLDISGEPSAHVNAVELAAKENGWSAVWIVVPYEFQRGGNKMLLLSPSGAA
jgi:hypothetical protein